MDIIEVIASLFVLVVVIYIGTVIAGTLFSTFGLFSAIGFVIKLVLSINSGEAITEPRVVMLLFGFSIISGIAGMIIVDHALPALLRGEWLTLLVILIIAAMLYFGGKEKLMEAWEQRS